MLQTIGLTKIYKPKKGVPVTALEDVSIRFPDTGMVFLLGKSGSGKSTLLNLLGGLDRYDSGEIIIKGTSSKNFTQQHFDSYRNTYVGFIFQEYNVLEEFSVGANIALAIELQGEKAEDAKINHILQEVDLGDYGNRKPNELSGGQKQRVAIARALVKDPRIIMADEPTGALDSVTGRQVLETLKRLSKDRLVIVVSHDQEFAMKYADRIIELSDGRVIRDQSYDPESLPAENAEDKDILFGQDQIEIKNGYHLTEEDRIRINEYIDCVKEDRIRLKISEKNGFVRGFTDTDESKIENHTEEDFRLIKSRLPAKSAVKIGANSLKHKKIRLVITILLSCIAFGLFGLADTFGAYNHIKTCTDSILDSAVPYVAVTKAKKVESDDYSWWDKYDYRLSEEDLKNLEAETGVYCQGVYLPFGISTDFGGNFNSEKHTDLEGYDIYPTYITGFCEVNADIMQKLQLGVKCGVLPDGKKNEIGISDIMCETFFAFGYNDGTTPKGENTKYEEIKEYRDMLGKTLRLDGTDYTITCVYDTGFDFDRYAYLADKPEREDNAESLVRFILFQELTNAEVYSMLQTAITGEGFIERISKDVPDIRRISRNWISFEMKETDDYYRSINPQFICDLSQIDTNKIIWIDGEKKTLGDHELIVSADMVNYWPVDENGMSAASLQEMAELIRLNNAFIYSDMDRTDDSADWTIAGIYDNTEDRYIGSTIIAGEKTLKAFTDPDEGIYSFAAGAMPKDRDGVETLVRYCYREDVDTRCALENSVTYELDTINEELEEFSKLFLYIGIGFAIFAALMLANFISTSIAYKKQEIGILRAIGSRSNDVFRIFFSESLIIALINFVCSATGTGIVTALINYYLRKHLGILVTVLHFGVRQVLLLLAVSVLIAAAASFIPVKRIASKRPIDAIRNR